MRPHVYHLCCEDFTDVTLADKDDNSIPTDEAMRAIPGNMAMQVGGPQIFVNKIVKLIIS